MFDFWKEPLTDEEREQLIEKAANEIRRRKLETPAVLFLEMHKPLAYLGSHAALAFSPFLVPFLGFDGVNNYSQLLAERGSVEQLLQRLEKGVEAEAEAAQDEEARC